MKKKLPKRKGNWKCAVAVSAVALLESGMFWYIKSPQGFKIPAPPFIKELGVLYRSRGYKSWFCKRFRWVR